jgi:hypothetical protein
LLDVDLDESAGQLLLFPRRSRLARPQADDQVLPAGRLAGVQGHGLDDAIALVEDAQQRDALRHRCDPAITIGRGGDLPRPRQRNILLVLAFAARGERAGSQQRCSESAHAYSGIQGS